MTNEESVVDLVLQFFDRTFADVDPMTAEAVLLPLEEAYQRLDESGAELVTEVSISSSEVWFVRASGEFESGEFIGIAGTPKPLVPGTVYVLVHPDTGTLARIDLRLH